MADPRARLKIEEVMGGLPEDFVFEQILSRLPIKHLLKLKCLSKSWYHLISNLCFSSKRKISSLCCGGGMGLITSDNNEFSSIIEFNLFHNVKGKGNSIELHFSLHRWSEVLDSCNGLLLCSIQEEVVENLSVAFEKSVYYVCNPMLNQWVVLPHGRRCLTIDSVGIYQNRDSVGDMAIAFDGIQGHHYKVVHFYLSEVNPQTGVIECEIFSSETGKWRQKQSPILVSKQVLQELRKWNTRYLECSMPSLYFKGVIYWTLEGGNYLLLFYVDEEVFKVLQEPGNDGFYSEKCLGESNGCLHYCSKVNDTLCLWAYMRHGNDIDTEWKWVLKHKVTIQTLMSQIQDHDYFSQRTCYPGQELCIVSLMFIGEARLVYFQSKGILFSYSFETKRLEMVHQTTTGRGHHFGKTMFSYVFNFADLPTWDGCEVLKPKLSSDRTCLMLLKEARVDRKKFSRHCI